MSYQNITDIICKHVIETTFEDLEELAVARLKDRVLDGIGDIAVGVHAPMCDELFQMVEYYQSPKNNATALFRGKKIAAAEAAMVNSLEMRSYDFEPVQCENKGKKCSAGHISGTTMPTALAAAEAVNASGKEFITALAVADDINARLGAATGFDVYSGWDSTNTINGLGATTAAGKLAGLTQQQLNNAYGIDLNTLGSTIDNINYKTMAFKFPMAHAARNAIFSAEYAQKGMTATHDAFGGEKGYFYLFGSEKQNPDLLLEDLGKVYYADVVIKPWSSCRVTQPSIDAIVQIVTTHEIDPKQVAKIIVHVTPRTSKGFCAQPWEKQEEPQVSAAFSIIYTAALAVVYKDVRPEHMTEAVMDDPQIKEMIDKVEIHPTLNPDEYVTANVDIIMKDGTDYFARCENVLGNIYHNPMSRQQILDKFYKNVDGKISRETADKVIDMVDHLENLASINELTALLI